MNPLLQKFNTPPFSSIKETDYKPAIKEAIALAKADIEAITKNAEKPNFSNTIEALDAAGEKLGRITSIFL